MFDVNVAAILIVTLLALVALGVHIAISLGVASALGIWSGWLTPVFEPKRYRTWFFVARLPEGQVTRDVSSESSHVVWLPAAEAADQADRGELAMLPPTYLTCLEVGTLGDVDAVLAASQDRTVTMFMPEVEPLGDGFTLSMPEQLRPLVAARRS